MLKEMLKENSNFYSSNHTYVKEDLNNILSEVSFQKMFLNYNSKKNSVSVLKSDY